MQCFLLIITFCFTCGEKKIWSNIKKPQNIMTMIVYVIFFCFFMSLLTAPIVKNSYIFARIYFIFLQKRPRPNFNLS